VVTFDSPEFLCLAHRSASLFINLLAVDPKFVNFFHTHNFHEKILHVYHMSPPDLQPELLVLSYNFYGAGAAILLDSFTVLGLYLARTDKALSIPGDVTLFWAPFVTISLLRCDINLNKEMILVIMNTMVRLFETGDSEQVQVAMWVLYFLFKQFGELCTHLVTETLATMIGKTLCHSDEIVVRIGLFMTAHLWLIDEIELRTIEMLNRAIPLESMIELLKSSSSRVNAGAAIALGNYMALHRVHFSRAISNQVTQIACEVIANGAAEAKREAAMLAGGILGQAAQDDLETLLTEEVVEILLDSMELDDSGLICHLAVAFSALLLSFPWIADVMLARDLDQFLIERLNLGFEVHGLHRTLARRRKELE
jgi:hypothetical protein